MPGEDVRYRRAEEVVLHKYRMRETTLPPEAIFAEVRRVSEAIGVDPPRVQVHNVEKRMEASCSSDGILSFALSGRDIAAIPHELAHHFLNVIGMGRPHDWGWAAAYTYVLNCAYLWEPWAKELIGEFGAVKGGWWDEMPCRCGLTLVWSGQRWDCPLCGRLPEWGAR